MRDRLNLFGIAVRPGQRAIYTTISAYGRLRECIHSGLRVSPPSGLVYAATYAELAIDVGTDRRGRRDGRWCVVEHAALRGLSLCATTSPNDGGHTDPRIENFRRQNACRTGAHATAATDRLDR